MQVVLFEDQLVGDLRPVSLTRAGFKITMGALDLVSAFQRMDLSLSYLVRPYLDPATALEVKNEPVTDSEVLFVNANTVPRIADLKKLLKACAKKERFCVVCDQRVAASYFPEIKVKLENLNPENITAFLQEDDPPRVELSLSLVTRPYEIVKYNMEIIGENLEHLADNYQQVQEGVYVGRNVKLAKFVSYDTSEGPVIIDDNSRVDDFALLIGPVYIGRNSKVNEHSAIKDCCSIGNTVKIGGEVEASVVESFSNKQHHGFLGHAYLGSWINIGAGTSNSDLKNTYGKVNVVYRGTKESTGMQFLGCIIGDYSKTAINTSIFTGKYIGVCSMVYGYATTNVASFTNWGQSLGSVTKYNLQAALTTQKRMFARRKIEQTPAHVELLKEVYRLTEDEHGPYPDKPIEF